MISVMHDKYNFGAVPELSGFGAKLAHVTFLLRNDSPGHIFAPPCLMNACGGK